MLSLVPDTRLGFFDHTGLVEHLRSYRDALTDLQQTGRSIELPRAFLRRLGADLIYATPEDEGAWHLRNDTRLHREFSEFSLCRLFAGGLALDWLTAAVICGRPDLNHQFMDRGELNWERGLQWFVLHGLREHRLYHCATRRFRQDLTRPSVPANGAVLAPLEIILLRERPDLIKTLGTPSNPRFRSAIQAWLQQAGVHEYGLSWCLDGSALTSDVLWRSTVRRLASVGAVSDDEAVKRYMRDGTGATAIDFLPASGKGSFWLRDTVDQLAHQVSLNTLPNERDSTAVIRIEPTDNGVLELPFGRGTSAERGIVDGLLGDSTARSHAFRTASVTLRLPRPSTDLVFLVIELDSSASVSGTLAIRVNDSLQAAIPIVDGSNGCLKATLANVRSAPDLSLSLHHLPSGGDPYGVPSDRMRITRLWILEDHA